MKQESFVRFSIPVLACFVALQACAPVVRVGPGTHLGKLGITRLKSLEGKAFTLAADKEKEELKAAEEDFAEMLAICKTALSTFERQAQTFRWIALILSVVGAAAGSVGVPALVAGGAASNAVPIAVLGGISGVTNTAQEVMRGVGLTSEEALKVRDAIREEWNKALRRYRDATTPVDRKKAIEEAAIACINYAVHNPAVRVDETPAKPAK